MSLTHRSSMVTIVIVAVVLRLLVFMIVVKTPNRAFNGGDSEQYILLAKNMVERGEFSLKENAPFTPDLIRTPGYPGLLAILFIVAGNRHDAVLIVAVQIILSVLNVFLILRIGEKILDTFAAHVGALLYALSPAAIIYTGLIMSETMFATLLLLGILALLKSFASHRFYLVIAGVLFGMAVYTRPIGLYFLPIPMLAIVTHFGLNRRSVLFAAALLATFFLSLLPWFYRNYSSFGTIVFTSVANSNLLIYNVGSIEAQRQHISLREAKDQLWEEYGKRLKALGITESNEAQNNQIMGAIASDHILAHPFEAALYQSLDMLNSLRPGYSMLTLLLHDDASEFGTDVQAGNLATIWRAPMPDVLIYLLITLYVLILYPVVVAGLIILFSRRSWLALIICGLIPLWFIYLPGAAGNARFRAPVEGLIALIGGVAFSAFARRFKCASSAQVRHEKSKLPETL